MICKKKCSHCACHNCKFNSHYLFPISIFSVFLLLLLIGFLLFFTFSFTSTNQLKEGNISNYYSFYNLQKKKARDIHL